MIKCQTVKDISIEDNKTERETNFTHEEQTIIPNKKNSIPVQKLNFNKKNILTKKNYQPKKNIIHILTNNNNNTISNISINSNSNNNIDDTNNNSYRTKIYQKKRIPVPQKGSLSKENEKESKKSISIEIKKHYITNDKYKSTKNFKIEGKKGNLSHEQISSIIPKVYKINKKKKISINNETKSSKIKKHLYFNHNHNNMNINKYNTNNNNNNNNNQKKSMSDRSYFEGSKKRVNSNNYKKLDLYKIKKINNININLNNINNKIEVNKIVKNINSCRNKNIKFDNINFLKKLNFDQPGKNKTIGINGPSENKSKTKITKILLNHHIDTDRIKPKKNLYTLNANINSNSNKKIIYKLDPRRNRPIILTPRNKFYNSDSNNVLKGTKKNICENNSMEFNVINIKNNLKRKKNNNNSNNNNKNNMQKNFSMQSQLNNNRNIQLELFDSSSSNIIKNDRINIIINNNGNDINLHQKKKINININNNYDDNIGTNESLTILNSSNSEIESYLSSNDITQIESVKDEKKNVISSHKLHLYLKEAKKTSKKKIEINSISNNHIKKTFLYITNTNKYNTNINDINKNNNKNKTVDVIDNENKIFKRNNEAKNKNSIYDYNTHTYNPLSRKLKLNNILFASINTNFKILLLKFLDKKSLLILSSVNKRFYNNFRKKIYKYFYEKIIKNNGNKDFMMKILNNIPKYASKILKSNLKNLKSKYEFYKRNKSVYNDIIKQDIIRTFPEDPSFKVDSINYNKLYDLLTCYSNYNKSIGYAQGLNFLAASSICLFKNEEKVFIFLDGLINRFKLNLLLSINNNKNLPKTMKYFSNILNKYCNEFNDYLSSKLLNHEFFSTSWLLTLFSNSMERNKLFICWCFMVIFGWKFFYSFVIQLLLFYKKSLLEINETKLSTEMKELLKRKQFIKDFNVIIKNTLNFMINNIVL